MSLDKRAEKALEALQKRASPESLASAEARLDNAMLIVERAQRPIVLWEKKWEWCHKCGTRAVWREYHDGPNGPIGWHQKCVCGAATYSERCPHGPKPTLDEIAEALLHNASERYRVARERWYRATPPAEGACTGERPPRFRRKSPIERELGEFAQLRGEVKSWGA